MCVFSKFSSSSNKFCTVRWNWATFLSSSLLNRSSSVLWFLNDTCRMSKSSASLSSIGLADLSFPIFSCGRLFLVMESDLCPLFPPTFLVHEDKNEILWGKNFELCEKWTRLGAYLLLFDSISITQCIDSVVSWWGTRWNSCNHCSFSKIWCKTVFKNQSKFWCTIWNMFGGTATTIQCPDAFFEGKQWCIDFRTFGPSLTIMWLGIWTTFTAC